MNRPIPDLPGYVATPDGHIVSAIEGRWSGRQLSEVPGRRGRYLCVRLNDRGKRRARHVHALVAEAFHGPREGRQVRHLNGDRRDNRASNLAWGTAVENAADRDAHGTTARGSRNGAARLNEAKVAEIRKLIAAGASQREMARRFGVTQRAIWDVMNGGWAHVARLDAAQGES